MVCAMREVRIHGTTRARHLVSDLYEVRAFAADRGYRILFAEEGRRSQVLLALHAVRKQTQRTPRSAIATAQAPRGVAAPRQAVSTPVCRIRHNAAWR